jgi:protoporphyrinogen oxidase
VTTVSILGSGMAGFGAAYRLHSEGVSSVMYDRNPYHGGHTASFVHPDGFIFDDGPHVSFTRDERIQELFAESVGGEYEIIQAQVDNYWNGHRIKHPAQCNLYPLPEDLVVRVLLDFIEAQRTDLGGSRNYREWLLAAYGQTFAETFPMEYGRKYHTAPPEEMTTDWLGPRLYRPELEEVLRGALSPSTADVHYVSHFRYPARGGFVSYLESFLGRTDLRLHHEAVRIDPFDQVITFADGIETTYEHLVSSLPLPEAVSMIDGAPKEVVDASQRLACTTCVVVNIGVNREDLSEANWTYFYDRDIFFTRLSFPHLLSRSTVPAGAGSVQAEVYYSSKYRPLDRRPDDCIESVLRDLIRCGVLRQDDEILHRSATLVPYANVIFDHDRAPALDVVRGFLEEMKIETCGRYGEWGYHWTDESFVSGEKAAQRILDRMGAPVR